MSFIRPEISASLYRLREVLAAVGIVTLGGWIALQGGYVLLPIGFVLLGIGLGWAVVALRRLRFQQAGDAPGVVRVTEAEIAYLGPRMGGFIGLPDLVEIRLLTLRGRRIWKLRQSNGELLHIPVESDGAEALFDAFASLPGMDTAALVAVLGTDAAPSDSKVVALNAFDRPVWLRAGAGVVVR